MNKTKIRNIGRRGKIGLAVLITFMFIGVASAALLDHYNTITVKANVKQAIVVDGKDITEPIEQVLDAVGGWTYCFKHNIKNRASIEGTVNFGTSYDPVLDVGSPEITTTYYKDSEPPYSYGPTMHGAVEVTVIDTGDGWLQWTYKDTSQMSVAINYPNGFVIHTSDGHHSPGWYYTIDGGATEPLSTIDWVEATGEDGTPGEFTVKIKKGALDNTFKWHGYAVNNLVGVWIEIGEPDWLPLASATIREEFTSLTLQPGELINFLICYEFAMNIHPDSNAPTTPNIIDPYTIITTVVLAP